MTRLPRLVLPAALGAALAASVAGNVVLASACLRYFANSEAIRLDPAGLEFHAPDRAHPPPPDRPVLVLFGDSRAKMWTAPDVAGRYAVVNRGVGYQTTEQILLRFDDDVAALRPAVVVLEAGVNDLKAIAEFPERREAIVAGCEQDLKRIVQRCRDIGATVVLCAIFDIGDVSLWRRPLWSDDVETAVREVNTFLGELAKTEPPPPQAREAAAARGPGVVLFDTNAVLDDERGAIRRSYQLDHLHLRPEGYDALNRKLVPLLASLAGAP